MDVSSVSNKAMRVDLRDTKHRDMIQNMGGINVSVRDPHARRYTADVRVQ